jgi:hypothetical protein
MMWHWMKALMKQKGPELAACAELGLGAALDGAVVPAAMCPQVSAPNESAAYSEEALS